jgi:hypothetical protein
MATTTKGRPRGRKGGRKSSPIPLFYKKLRATPERQAEFIALMTGDAAKDFDLIYNLLQQYHTRDTRNNEQPK